MTVSIFCFIKKCTYFKQGSKPIIATLHVKMIINIYYMPRDQNKLNFAVVYIRKLKIAKISAKSLDHVAAAWC